MVDMPDITADILVDIIWVLPCPQVRSSRILSSWVGRCFGRYYLRGLPWQVAKLTASQQQARQPAAREAARQQVRYTRQQAGQQARQRAGEQAKRQAWQQATQQSSQQATQQPKQYAIRHALYT